MPLWTLRRLASKFATHRVTTTTGCTAAEFATARRTTRKLPSSCSEASINLENAGAGGTAGSAVFVRSTASVRSWAYPGRRGSGRVLEFSNDRFVFRPHRGVGLSPVISSTAAGMTSSCKNNAAQALQDIEDAHQAACDAGVSRYSDPSTGYKVFTQASHEERGFCCGNACRHCPFGHVDVIPEYRPAGSVPKTALFSQFRKGRKAKLTVGKSWKAFKDDGELRDILFWSGGKDSLLALRALQEENRRSGRKDVKITLLTAYDGVTGNIPFQGTKVNDVMQQAKQVELDILTVPLKNGPPTTAATSSPRIDSTETSFSGSVGKQVYLVDSYAETVLAALKPLRVNSLAFGDLRLQDLREWRERAFSGDRGYPCRFPIFGVPYKELLFRLWAEQEVTVNVTHVNSELEGTHSENGGTKGLSVGDVFQESFVADLPEGVDVMGENGEFHTHVFFQEEITRWKARRSSTTASTSSVSDDSNSSDYSDTESSRSEDTSF